MAQQHILLGTVPNDSLGSPLRDGGDMINDNFDELYPAVALNTAKITNATHTGDATGSGALTLATVNASPGTYTNAQITVNAKGLVTAAASGTSTTSAMKYSGSVNLLAGVDTQHVTTIPAGNEPYSIMLIDSSDIIITHSVEIELTTSGGFVALNIYSVDAMNNVKVKIIY
ncbi:MAG: hypothetical protein ABFC18_03475 [Rikenellaceae bacterium]